MIADSYTDYGCRIYNVIEGIVRDPAHGRIPDFRAEKGRTAEWKHNRAVLLGKIAVKAAAVSAIVFLLAGKRKKA